jgi:C1A family cysteine protease
MHELIRSGTPFNQNWAANDVSPGDRIAPAFAYYTTRQIMGTQNQDSGVDNRSLFQALLKYGSAREADMPYNPSVYAAPPNATAYGDASKWEHVSYKSVVPTHNNLRSTLVQGHAIVQAFSVPDYFEEESIWNPASEFLPLPQNVRDFQQFIGGHDVVITGYDYTKTTWPVPVFIIDNSWDDTDWGLAFEAPSGRPGRFAMDARWQGSSNLVFDLTALISDAA